MLKPQRNVSRETISLDGFWEFRRDPEKSGEARDWPRGLAPEFLLAVPASWNEQRDDLADYFGVAWYQTTLAVPPGWAGRGVSVHFGSVQRRARVWLNGTLVGRHDCGSLPFECELSDALRLGADNLLVVEVDGSLNPWDLPPSCLNEEEARVGFHRSNPGVTYDFFPFAGIPRPVTIQLTAERRRIESLTVESEVTGTTALVQVEVGLRMAPNCEVVFQVEEISIKVANLGNGVARATLCLPSPRLWDIGKPELYRGIASLFEGEKLLDRYELTFGVRSIEVTGDELLLNGRPVFLTGLGKHEDFPVLGRGLSTAVIVRDFDLMTWIGANSFRTSHYPYAEEWYDFADRAGFLIIGETPFVGLNQRMYTPPVLEDALGVVRKMIQRDRHHPSVVMWSLANEPDFGGPEGEAFMLRLFQEVRRLDPRRPITYVAHREPQDNSALRHCDVVCINKYYGWYEQPGEIKGSLNEFGACLDRFRAAFGKPIILAEFGADAVAGMHSTPPEMFSEEYQAEIIASQYLEARRRPWVIGAHVWAFADFKTAQSITRVGMNRKGVFTRDRRPKMAAHRLRELWQNGSQR